MDEPAEAGARAGADCDVVVIGAGFAGLYAIHKLTRLGFSVIAFERGGDVGGVWYWNRYPGARCDCESYYYSYSFSDELQKAWSWSLRYSEQPEILRYLSHVADRFDLRRHIRFSATVEQARFDEATSLWTVRAGNGEVVSARFVVSAAGCLSAIQKPDIPGLDRFEGEVHYTAAWPHEGVDFTGKRVGVVGTGASGVQAISRIAPQAKALTVFQRTANWVIPVWNRPMSAEFDAWSKAHHAEFRAKCLASAGAVPFDPPKAKTFEVSDAERQAIFDDYWARGGTQFFGAFTDLFSNLKANDAAAEVVRQYIRKVVDDPAIAETLIPTDHPLGTKRPPMDDDYYATFNLENVRLVDIRKSPITGIQGRTLQTKEGAYELDALVLATGFDAISGALLSIDIVGRDGRSLRDEWAKGARTYLGLGMAGFPNLFTVTGPLSPSVLANMPTAVEQHVDWIADCLVYMREHGLAEIEPGEAAQDDWVSHVAEVASGSLYQRANSWYLGANIPGKPRQFGVYLGGFGAYKQRCDSVAERGYEGFERRSV
jgi:cyclohexanone monooxygenase